MRKFHKDLIIGKVNTKVLNITLLAENDFEAGVDFYRYANTSGNCLAVALCDIYNNDNNCNFIEPCVRSVKNEKKYCNLCDVIVSCADRKKTTLNDLVNVNFSGVVVICCKGGYHAIAMINGKFLNNWRLREPVSLNYFLEDIGYIKSPKVCYYIDSASIFLNKKIIDALISFNTL